MLTSDSKETLRKKKINHWLENILLRSKGSKMNWKTLKNKLITMKKPNTVTFMSKPLPKKYKVTTITWIWVAFKKVFWTKSSLKATKVQEWVMIWKYSKISAIRTTIRTLYPLILTKKLVTNKIQFRALINR